MRTYEVKKPSVDQLEPDTLDQFHSQVMNVFYSLTHAKRCCIFFLFFPGVFNFLLVAVWMESSGLWR